MICIVAAASTALALLTGGHSGSDQVVKSADHLRVRQIADLMLRDVAVAVYDPVSPIIYYNPEYLDRFSPEMQAFFLAHERAHIELKHTRSSALRSDQPNLDQQLQSKELAADCLAVTRLGVPGRQASLAAMRYFARLGPEHNDDEHPTGTARARSILECMP